jgi:2-methylcitrate dehydratase PrpD
VDYGQQLADFGSSQRWANLPPEVQNRARDRLLDALSTAAGSVMVGTSAWKAARKAFVDQSPAFGVGATAIGSTQCQPPEAAAFVNGVAVHSILYEDFALHSSDHPGATVCPAALAVAESNESSRDALLTAIVVGYEVQLLLGYAAPEMIRRGFRSMAVLGTVGAAAAVASLVGLDRDRFATALALAANASAGLMQAWAHGTDEPFLHAGAAAAAGMAAVRLASSGARAAPTTFNGPNGFFQAYAGTSTPKLPVPGATWQITSMLACKPYPTSGAKTTAVDSAIAAVRAGVTADSIKSVRAYLPEVAVVPPGANRPGPFTNVTQAQDSAQFCLAAALSGRNMKDLNTYFKHFAAPDIDELTRRIELVAEADRSLGRLVIRMNDGNVLEFEVDARNEQNPSVASMRAKLLLLAPAVWPAEVAIGLADWIEGNIEGGVPSFSQLLRSITEVSV